MRERIQPGVYSRGRVEIAHARLASCQASEAVSHGKRNLSGQNRRADGHSATDEKVPPVDRTHGSLLLGRRMFEYVSLYCHDQMLSKRDDVTERKIIAAERRFRAFCSIWESDEEWPRPARLCARRPTRGARPGDITLRLPADLDQSIRTFGPGRRAVKAGRPRYQWDHPLCHSISTSVRWRNR